MSNPDVPTEQQVREIAREEAQSVYDDLTVVDDEGNETSLSSIQTRVNALAPDLSRRESLKIAIVAFGYVASGAAISSAILNAMAGTASADAQGQVGTSTDPLTALFTEEASVTNETFIRATRGSDSSSTTAGTFINLYDGESKDSRGEYNASAQFVPDESGEYMIWFGSDIRGNTTVNDQISLRVRDVDAGTTVNPGITYDRQTTAGGDMYSGMYQLTAGQTYELQATNQDSSFVVKGVGNANAVGYIVRSVVDA